jgi:hypothetical protein
LCRDVATKSTIGYHQRTANGYQDQEDNDIASDAMIENDFVSYCRDKLENCKKGGWEDASQMYHDSNVVAWYRIPKTFARCGSPCSAGGVAEDAIEGKELDTSKCKAHQSTREDEDYLILALQ